MSSGESIRKRIRAALERHEAEVAERSSEILRAWQESDSDLPLNEFAIQLRRVDPQPYQHPSDKGIP